MIHNLTKYFLEPSLLDNLSITDIENEIDEAPFAFATRMLLAKKMSNFENQQLMLLNNDRVWIHYFKDTGNKIPNIFDIVNLNTDNKIDLIHEYQEDEKTGNIEEFDKMNFNSETKMESIVADNIIIQETEKLSPITSTESIVETPKKVSKVSSKNKKKKIKKFKLNEYRGISEFSKWLLSFKKDDIEKQIKKEEKAARKKAFGESAKKSVTKSATIISESLAEILASQGHLDDAKKMYEQLMVKYPEKSSYFAAKLETLIKI